MSVRLILIGPPGVGKGTQAALIEERMGGPIQLSSGVIFRAEIEAKTDLGELAQSYIDRGALVPDGVTIQMMLKRLRAPEARKQGFILDGFPRTVRQAEALDVELEKEEITLDKVVSLEAPDELILSRLEGRSGCTKCGAIYHSVNKPPKREGFCDNCNSPLIVRSDDTGPKILARLETFRQMTAPVLDYYEAKGQLLRVDSSREAEAVYQDIASGLQK